MSESHGLEALQALADEKGLLVGEEAKAAGLVDELGNLPDAVERAGRLAGIKGIYIPVRDNNRLLDTIGWAMVFLTILGVVGHGAIRIVSSRKH